MSVIPEALFSNIILPFLEHPEDDTSLRRSCKKWQFIFPQTINLHIQNAIAASSVNFLITKYENQLREHGNRFCIIHSIQATLVRPLEYIPMNICLSSLKKLNIKNASWQSLAICSTTSLEELSMEGELDWSVLVQIKDFINLHTLTLIQTANAPLIEDVSDLRNLQHLPIQKLRIDDSHLNLSHFSELTEFPHLVELILDHVSSELYNNDNFRTKALEMNALKQINGQPDTMWRPIFANAHNADEILLIEDAPANVNPDEVAQAEDLETGEHGISYWLCLPCVCLRALILSILEYLESLIRGRASHRDS